MSPETTAAWITAGGATVAFLGGALISYAGFIANRRMQLWQRESEIYTKVLNRTAVRKSIRKKQLQKIENATTQQRTDILAEVAKSYAPENEWRGVEAQLSAYGTTSIYAAYTDSASENEALIEAARSEGWEQTKGLLSSIITKDDALIAQIRNECGKLRKVNLTGRKE